MDYIDYWVGLHKSVIDLLIAKLQRWPEYFTFKNSVLHEIINNNNNKNKIDRRQG